MEIYQRSRNSSESISRTDSSENADALFFIGERGIHAPKPFSEVRMEHVNRLRKAIANGQYFMRPEELAQKLLETMREDTGLRFQRES